MDDLIIELEAVTNWFVLGLHLGVTPCKLKLLKNKKMSVEYKRNRMLVEWINNHHKPTWSTVVHALEGMNELQLAGHITVKYGQFVSSQLILTIDIRGGKGMGNGSRDIHRFTLP